MYQGLCVLGGNHECHTTRLAWDIVTQPPKGAPGKSLGVTKQSVAAQFVAPLVLDALEQLPHEVGGSICPTTTQEHRPLRNSPRSKQIARSAHTPSPIFGSTPMWSPCTSTFGAFGWAMVISSYSYYKGRVATKWVGYKLKRNWCVPLGRRTGIMPASCTHAQHFYGTPNVDVHQILVPHRPTHKGQDKWPYATAECRSCNIAQCFSVGCTRKAREAHSA